MQGLLRNFIFVCCTGLGTLVSHAEALVSYGRDARLDYAQDSRGNRLPDFSRAGYGGGGVALPQVPVVKVLRPRKSGDDTARIQAVIDELSLRKPDEQGFRGALLLKRGEYRISGSLKLNASGVILRGEGQQEEGAVLLATGKERRTLILVGEKSRRSEVSGSRRDIVDEYVPWGALSFHLSSTKGFSVGDSLIVYRPSTAEWIHEIGMDQIVEREGTQQWTGGGSHMCLERTITEIKGNRIAIDAPVMTALDKRYGGGYVYRYTRQGQLSQIGVEKIRLISEYDTNNEFDEKHAWTGVSVSDASNVWIKNVTTVHFSHGISLMGGARFVTVQDCAYLQPISQITGGRRYPYYMDDAQYCLVQRCYSRDSRHAEATGSATCGPNVFLDCLAENTFADTGPHHRWASGILWDNLKGGDFNAQDRGCMGSGHGWAGALQVFWNCETDSICVQQPPTAQNYAIGCTGQINKGHFKPRDPGHYESHGKHVAPRSLYLQQLKDRLGQRAVENVTTAVQRDRTLYQVLKAELSH